MSDISSMYIIVCAQDTSTRIILNMYYDNVYSPENQLLVA